MKIKRLFDLVVVLSGLLLAAPVMLMVSASVLVLLGRPVIFSQLRPGLHGHLFTIYKFRTMSDKYGPDGVPLPDAERLNWFGKSLRKTSLDELPELFNVLRGDMSLVGPRPLLAEYLPLYTSEQARRHNVKPGITGWAQINGRNAISWEEKFDLDIWYVDNRSLVLDIRILWLTVLQVFRGSGVSHADHVTMTKYTGSKQCK